MDHKEIKIHLATDHAGFKLKETVKERLDEAGYTIVDHGAGSFNKEDDYPDFIHPAAKAVSQDEHARGIIFGYSGQGEAVVANRYPYVRAVVYYGEPAETTQTREDSELDIITLSREHNDANILSIGAGFVSEIQAREAVDRWLDVEFTEATRHKRRINKIDDNLDRPQ